MGLRLRIEIATASTAERKSPGVTSLEGSTAGTIAQSMLEMAEMGTRTET